MGRMARRKGGRIEEGMLEPSLQMRVERNGRVRLKSGIRHMGSRIAGCGAELPIKRQV